MAVDAMLHNMRELWCALQYVLNRVWGQFYTQTKWFSVQFGNKLNEFTNLHERSECNFWTSSIYSELHGKSFSLCIITWVTLYPPPSPQFIKLILCRLYLTAIYIQLYLNYICNSKLLKSKKMLSKFNDLFIGTSLTVTWELIHKENIDV